MRKAFIVMFLVGLGQAMGSSGNEGWEHVSSMRRSSVDGQSYAPHNQFYEYDEGYQRPGFWNSKHKVSADELAEGMDDLLDGLGNLATYIWNFITK